MDPIFEELPAPPKPLLTEEQRYRRHRRFAVVLNAFVLAYSLIHKFLLPVYLNYVVRSASFAPMDAWWLYHVLLAVLLLRKNWDDLSLRLALFFGAGGAACQLLVSFRERNWHSVSLWVTAASTLWVVFFLLSKTRFRFPARRGPVKAGLKVAAVALGFFVQFAFFGFTFTLQKAARVVAKKTAFAESFPVLADPNACGVEGFRLSLQEGVPQVPAIAVLTDVGVQDCGFPAALASFDPSRGLTLENRTSRYLNVKAYVPAEGRWRPLQNMPLPPGLSHLLPPAALSGRDVILLASDADPQKGILLLLSRPSALAETLANAPGDEKPAWVEIDRKGLSLRR